MSFVLTRAAGLRFGAPPARFFLAFDAVDRFADDVQPSSLSSTSAGADRQKPNWLISEPMVPSFSFLFGDEQWDPTVLNSQQLRCYSIDYGSSRFYSNLDGNQFRLDSTRWMALFVLHRGDRVLSTEAVLGDWVFTATD